MKQAELSGTPEPVDQQPFSRFHVGLVMLLCGTLVFADGFDALVMGFAAPAMIPQFHITRTAMGSAISIGLFGMLIGALAFGSLADNYGRKPILIGCTLMFALGSLFTAASTSLPELLVVRLITGLGLGGVMPNAIALTAECSPQKVRATAVMTMLTGSSIGAASGGFVAAALITRFGWQSVFVVGGVAPLLFAVPSSIWLPESIHPLARDAKEGVNSYLTRMGRITRRFKPRFIRGDKDRAFLFAVKQLLARGRAKITLLLWTVFFMNLLVVYLLNSWLPVAMHDNGIGIHTAILVTTLFQVGGTLGAIVLGRFFDRGASFGLLAILYGSACVAVLLINEALMSNWLLSIVFICGFCTVGGQISANALSAQIYPTPIRSTGVGWALGIGRIGSIVGPVVGGILLSGENKVIHVFWAAAAAGFIATIAALRIAFSTRKTPSGIFIRNAKEGIIHEGVPGED